MKRQNIGKQVGRLLLALVVLVFFAGTSYTQGDDEGKSYVRISYIEKGVTLQRATEVASETPIINILLMAGDRLWTDETGRVECQFENGTILRMNGSTKVDFQSIFDTAASYKSSTILRMWSGSIYLKTVNLEAPDENFQIDTPACSVYLISDGTFRIDLDEENNTRLSVYNGVAETVSEGESVLIKSGQRCYISPNEYPSEPEPFNTASFDSFDEWNYQREETLAVAVSQQYISPEATYYISELEPYGAWHYYARYQSYVWRPYYMDSYWIPYTYGRWNWYPCGWTWISYYQWGWIPFHYGWWDWTPLWGWVWVPGTYWSPAWVYWAAGSHYIGWTPYTYGYWRSGIYASMYKYNYGRYNRFDSKHWTFIPRNAIANPDIRKVKYNAEQINKLNVADAQFYNPKSARSVGELQRRAMSKSGYNIQSNAETKTLPKDINRAPPEAVRKVKGTTTTSTTEKGKVFKQTPSTSREDTSVTSKEKVTPTRQEKTGTPSKSTSSDKDTSVSSKEKATPTRQQKTKSTPKSTSSGKDTSVTSKGKVTPTKQQKTKAPPKAKKVKSKPKTPPPTASSRSTSQTWKGLSSSSSTSSASKENRITTSYSQQPKSTSSSYRYSKSSTPRRTPSLSSSWPSSSKSVTSRSAKSSSYSPSTSSSLKSRTPSLRSSWPSSSKSVTPRRTKSTSYSPSTSSSSRSRTTSLKSSWPSSSKSVTSRTARSTSSAWRSLSSPSSASRYRTYSSTPSRYYSHSQPRYRVPSYSPSLKSSYRPSYSSPTISRGSSSFRSFSGSSSIRSGAVRSSTPSRSYSPSRSSSVRSSGKAVKKR